MNLSNSFGFGNGLGTSGTVSSVGLAMPSPTTPAFTVSNSPVTGSGTLTVTANGSISQYVRGDGSLASFPSLTGYVPYTGATQDLNLGSNNLYVNNVFSGFTSVAASATLITLIVNSTPYYLVTGSGGQTIKLPNATTLQNGSFYIFNNNQSSGAILVNNNSNTLVKSIPSGANVIIELIDNSIAAGSWDVHSQAPSNVSWSTNTFDYAGSITSATWNGSTIAINRGGTGATTASAALSNLGGIGLTSLSFAAGSGAYNNTTGVITIPTNNNQITNGAGYITSSALSSYVPYTGATADVSIGNFSFITNRTLSLTATDGNSYIQSAWQSASPTGVASTTTMWFDSIGRINWRPATGASSFIRTFDATGIAQNSTWTLPNISSTILAGLAVTQTFAGVNTFSPSFAASSGTTATNSLIVSPTINNTGSYSGTARGIYYNPTLTSITGTTHVAYENVSGYNFLNTTSNSTRIGTNTILYNSGNYDAKLGITITNSPTTTNQYAGLHITNNEIGNVYKSSISILESGANRENAISVNYGGQSNSNNTTGIGYAIITNASRYGFSSNSTISGNGTINTGINSFNTNMYFQASGGNLTVGGSLYGYQSTVQLVPSGNTLTVSNIYDFYVGLLSGNTAGGNVTNRYGLRLDLDNTYTTNSWGIYQSASVTNNYFAGNIGIGTTSTINASAILQITSTTKGVLFPRMTTAQKTAISTPPSGLVVYDTDLGKLCVRGAINWETITSV
jgi:hypothetical protein